MSRVVLWQSHPTWQQAMNHVTHGLLLAIAYDWLTVVLCVTPGHRRAPRIVKTVASLSPVPFQISPAHEGSWMSSGSVEEAGPGRGSAFLASSLIRCRFRVRGRRPSGCPNSRACAQLGLVASRSRTRAASVARLARGLRPTRLSWPLEEAGPVCASSRHLGTPPPAWPSARGGTRLQRVDPAPVGGLPGLVRTSEWTPAPHGHTPLLALGTADRLDRPVRKCSRESAKRLAPPGHACVRSAGRRTWVSLSKPQSWTNPVYTSTRSRLPV